MGGQSTSQSAPVSRHKTQGAGKFDLHNWQGLTAVLKAGKESLKDPSAYAAFRNLVLEYAQKGGDAEVRKKIDAIIATFGTAPSDTSPVRQEVPISEAVPVVTSVETSSTTKAVKGITTPIQQESVSPQNIQAQEDKNTHTKTALFGRQRVQPTFTTPPSSQRTSFIPQNLEPSSQEERTAPVQQRNEEIVTPAEVAPDPVMHEPAVKPNQAEKPRTVEEYKVRIAEIKHEVTAHVGNPAALVGAHGALGKAYMTALLTALKSTTAGNTGGIEGAMASLERAAHALMHDEGTSVPVIQDVVVKVTESIPPVSPTVTREPEVVVEAAAETVQTNAVPEVTQDAPQTEIQKEEKVTVVPEQKVEKSVPVPPISKMMSQVSPQANASSRKYSAAQLFASAKPKAIQSTETPLPRPPMPNIDDVPLPKPTSVVREESVVTQMPAPQRIAEEDEGKSIGPKPQEIPVTVPSPTEQVTHTAPVPHEVKAVTPEVSKVPPDHAALHAPEVTQALEQLLHEWNIFSNSGLFGIGPGGSEHPLYQKLSSIRMADVLAGAWDKSDPKVVKTIKQYVDAWRHEQGVAYLIDETFEHYLRRVVQRILKRQS